ncbi:retrotransposon protein, putative, ty1-copia subclass [Tanacetum coccineum]
MTGAKFDIEKFDGTGDFGLWRIKMRALLIQHGCEAALEVLPADMEAEAKAELNKKAHSAVILCLGNKVLREVTGETTAAGVWTKLETLYMTKEGFDNEEVDGPLLNSKEIKKRSKAKGDECYVKKDDQPSSSGSTYDDSEVMMVMSTQAQALLDLIMDSGCSYHMTPEGFTVKMQSGKVKVINGSRVVLSGTRRDNCVYSLDGHAMAGELNASIEEKDSLAQVWHKRLGHISEAGLQVLEKQVWVAQDLWAEATCTAAYLINRTPIETSIEKKTPMEMWSGHPSDYGMLRIFGCVAYPHNKQGKLEPRAIKCVLLGYPEGVKGYRLYRLDNESPKIVTSRNVVFNESVMYKDTLKDSGVGDKSVEELQVEVELQRLNNHTHEEDQIDQEDGNDEDAEDQKPITTQDSQIITEEEDTHEPLTYQEAVACEDSSKWKAAMKEEMDSLRKNKTWELVDPPAGQKLVSSKWLYKIKEGIECVQKARYKARLDGSFDHTEGREVLEAKTVEVLKVGTEHNAADALTKVVPPLETETIPAARVPSLTLADFEDFEFDWGRFKVPLLETETVPTSLESTAYFSEATEEQLGYDERELPLFGMIKAQNTLSDPSHDGSFYMFNADGDADPDPSVYTNLWVLCQSYGTVVDVFIPNRMSKAGKRFAFVRFIKVDNVERLVGNLCTLWIGRKHLQANVARFDRDSIPSKRVPHKFNHVAPTPTSFVSAVKGVSSPPIPLASSPALVLDDSCMVARDLDNFVMGEVLNGERSWN